MTKAWGRGCSPSSSSLSVDQVSPPLLLHADASFIVINVSLIFWFMKALNNC